MFCKKCGKELPEEACFCSACGNSTNEVIAKEQEVGVYKTEILKVSFKLIWTNKATTSDTAELDKLLNQRKNEGWELVTYNYMATDSQLRGAFIVTFRKIT